MERLAIIGAGELGSQIAYHSLTDKKYLPIGFYDDFITNNNIGYPILGKIDDVISHYKKGAFDVLMIGIGYLHMDLREKLFNEFSQIIPFGKIVHSSAFIDESSKIEDGVIIYPRCIIDSKVTIRKNVLLNIGCVIAHDSIIGNHSFLSPAVNIAGFVNIGAKVNLGIGTTIIDNIKISDNVRTGGGAVIIKNIESSGLYVGIPAQKKKP